MKWFPDAKVINGGIGSILAWAALAGINAGFHFDLAGFLQPYIDSLFTAICAANATTPCPLPSAQVLLAVVLGQGFAYAMPPAERDIIKRMTDGLIQKAQDDPSVTAVTKPAAR